MKYLEVSFAVRRLFKSLGFKGLTLPAALCPWDQLSLQQKWAPGYPLGCKGGRCV